MRILLIEDEDSIRSALALALTRDGHTVQVAAGLVPGRAIAAELHPELLVSDLKLPDGSGLDLAEELGLPVVMLSGYATFDDAVRALRLGAVDFFTKPVAIKDVRQAVRRAVERQAPSRHDDSTWRSVGEARSAWEHLLPHLPGVIARLVAAELCRAGGAHGRLVVDRSVLRLDAVPVDGGLIRPWITTWAEAVSWGEAGVLVRLPSESHQPYDPDRELLWPVELPEGVLDARQWLSLGSWALPRLATAGTRLAGIAPQLQDRLLRVDIDPESAPAALGTAGIGSAERAGLIDPPTDGTPVA